MSVPTYPLTCNVWQTASPFSLPPAGAPAFTVMCELRPLYTGNLVAEQGQGGGMLLLTPKGTDLRPQAGWFTALKSQVECPAGSGRYYVVQSVDDVLKGTSREYRFAIMIWRGAVPVPIP